MADVLAPPRSYFEFIERVKCIAVLSQSSMTSGWRTEARNAAVGGNPNSRHLFRRGSWAADCVPDDNTAERRAKMVDAGKRLGLRALDEGTHVHFAA